MTINVIKSSEYRVYITFKIIIFYCPKDINRPLIHFEFIFVYDVRKCPSFILLQVVDQFPSTTC